LKNIFERIYHKIMSVKVSIVIPTYNRKESLKKALESLFNQTYLKDDYEILVCDDYKSTDGTEEMVKELMKEAPCELRYLKVKSNCKGPATARNAGIENARGEIIGFTDDDCIVSPNWIEKALSHLCSMEICGVRGITVPIARKKELKGLKKLFYIVDTQDTREFLGRYDYYPTCNIFYRKEQLKENGGFDPRLYALEDADIAWRLLEKGHKIIFSKNVLVYHETRYISLLKYLKSLKKQGLLALFIRKHPGFREKLALRFIALKTNIYPIFILLAASSYVVGWGIFFNIFVVAAILLYLWARVITDTNIKMYPLRILAFIRYFLIDFISLFYTVKGAIRYRCFII